MVRAPFYDKNGVKKGAWSREEDERLRAFVLKYGHSNWRQLPKFAGLARCGKSCRLRWLNYLRPNLKHGNYTQEEEKLIIKLHQELGNRWSQIAEKLPGRTDNEIKNYWHSHLKKFIIKRNDITTTSPSDKFKSKPLNDTYQVKTTTNDHQFITESERSSGYSDEYDGANNYFHHVLESSLAISTETSSYIEENINNDSLIITSNNIDAQSTMNCPRTKVESVVLPSVTYQEFSGDFWTDPFIVEGSYIDDEISSGDGDGDGLNFLIQYLYELGTDLY